MIWVPLSNESVVVTTTLVNNTAVKRNVQRWGRVNEAIIGTGIWMWCADEPGSDDGQVGAAAVCKHGYQLTSHGSYLGVGCRELSNGELRTIGLELAVLIETRETLQRHRLTNRQSMGSGRDDIA
jgi:hypothetical protein